MSVQVSKARIVGGLMLPCLSLMVIPGRRSAPPSLVASLRLWQSRARTQHLSILTGLSILDMWPMSCIWITLGFILKHITIFAFCSIVIPTRPRPFKDRAFHLFLIFSQSHGFHPVPIVDDGQRRFLCSHLRQKRGRCRLRIHL